MQSLRPDPEAAPHVAAPQVVELDVRHLPAPEPMLRILDALATLPDGAILLARTPFRPQPLLDQLEADGYRVTVEVAPAGDALVRISSADGLARA